MTPDSHEGNSEASTSRAATPLDEGGAKPVKAARRSITRRKIKCDRSFPCGNCKKRGREDRTVSIRSNRSDPSKSNASKNTDDQEPLRAEIEDLHRQLSAQAHLITSLQQSSAGMGAGEGGLEMNGGGEGGSGYARNGQLGGGGEVDGRRPSLHDALLDAAFGSYGMESTAAAETNLRPARSRSQSLKWTSDDGPWAGRPLMDLVPVHCSSLLVRAYSKFIGWMHCAVHWPSFIAQHDQWIELVRQGRAEVRNDWLALYFAIISGSLFYLDSVIGEAAYLSPEEVQSLPKLWFECSQEALKRSDFLSRPTFENLQTICVMPLVAHNFGASAYCSSLLHLGLGIAQRFNLHRLGPETRPSPKIGQIKLEVGRRIWVGLLVGECMSPMALKPDALFFSMAKTAPPSNVNDENLSDHFPMMPLPLDHPTGVSHRLAMRQVALIYRTYNKSFHRAKTIEEQFNICLEADQSLVNLLNFCPALIWRGEQNSAIPSLTEPFDYIPWAREDLSCLIPISRIRVYTPLYARSFQESRFNSIRQVCLDSARQFLMEKTLNPHPLYRKSWFVWAHTVVAGTVLATELLNGEDTPAAKALLHEEVLAAIAKIRLGETISMIAYRGANLLQKMVDAFVTPSLANVNEYSLPENTNSDWICPWPTIQVDAVGNLMWTNNGAWDNVMGEYQWNGLQADVPTLP